MKKLKKLCLTKFKINYFYLIGLLFLFSCENNDTTTALVPDNASTINDVSKDMATNAAQVFLSKYHTSSASRITDITKTIEDVFTFKTISNENAFYAINYVEGGFVVVSADNRVSPILAFSDEGKFSNNIDEIPDPVVSWIEVEKESVQLIKDSQLTQLDAIHLEWDYLLTITGNPSLCENLIIQKGPLLTTAWGQGNGYNNAIGHYCSTITGGHAWTGCVATAMAQVLKFHQMPDVGGSLPTQQLMSWIGQSVDMHYGCDASSASMNGVSNSFQDSFGYSDARYTTMYNPDLIFNQISLNLPVILTGGRQRSGITFPWNYYADGHAWVSDGFLFVFLRAPDVSGNCQTYGFRFLHMNWGWGDNINNTYNGWFNENYCNPYPGAAFNYRRGVEYNIIP